MSRGKPLDSRGMLVVVGQPVTIEPNEQIIHQLFLSPTRLDLAGASFHVDKIWWVKADGGAWYASGANLRLTMFPSWPTECLKVESVGLRGLITRYRTEDAHGR